MNDHTLSVAVGLRLGTAICAPHQCQHCDEEVSEGRHHRHATVNSITHRALVSAKIPLRLEPTGMFRAGGKRPDGATVVPWSRGQLLVWDATFPDTLATSYRCQATCAAGKVTAAAEERKVSSMPSLAKHTSLRQWAIVTLCSFGPKTWPL